MSAVPARASRLAALVSERSATRALVSKLQAAASAVRARAPLTAADYHARSVYFEGMIARLDAQISNLWEG
jgi:hypothetical protein